jgi:hypothetical protein
MPGPVGAFAENQPVTPIVNTIRDLYVQQPVSTDIWIPLVWCAGILIVAYIFAMVAYRRRISQQSVEQAADGLHAPQACLSISQRGPLGVHAEGSPREPSEPR